MCEDVFSAYYLEQYVLGEISGEIADRIRLKAAADPIFRSELEAIEASNREVLALYPPERFKKEIAVSLSKYSAASAESSAPHSIIESQESLPFFSTRRILAFSTAAAMLLIFLFVVLPTLNEHSTSTGAGGTAPADPAGVILVKGEQVIDLNKTQLLVYRKIEDSVEMLDDAQAASEGDLLQLAYVAAGDGQGVILSIDGRGMISLHYPSERDGSTHLEQNRKILLPNAIELDDAPDFERFFLISSQGPINVPQILEIAGNLADSGDLIHNPLDLPKGINQFSFLILKGEVR